MRWRWTERTQDAADVLMAVGIATIGQIEAWTAPAYPEGQGAPDIVGPRLIVAASYLAAALVLVVRRRHPFGVLAVVVASLGLPFLLFGSSEGFGSMLPMLVASYSVAAHCERRSAVLGLGLLTLFAFVHGLRDPLIHDIGDVFGALPYYLLTLICWLAGFSARTWRLYAAEHRARTAQAEREREQRVLTTIAEERAQIARELHDAVAHAMSVMVVQAEAAEELLDTEPRRSQLALKRIQQTGRDGLAEMRRVLGVLREDESPALAPQPGLDSLGPLLDKVREAGLPVELAVDGDPRELPTGIDASAYRIVQEALTNALRHSGASHARVRVGYRDPLELVIEDDGIGGLPTGDGHGILGMRERAAVYGGTLEVGPASAGGFRVRAVLPLRGRE